MNIPNNALLSSADAVSMYTNIDTQQAINSMQDFIQVNLDKIPSNFPTTLFLNILEIVMNNNIFSFGDTFWLQLTCTAMGMPAACSYATITFGQHENIHLLPKYRSHLLYYKHYIDDIFGVWLPSETDNCDTWDQIKNDLNSWVGLHWKTEEPSHKTVFLDLNIQITVVKIHTSTYQKSLNLYLCIPPLSVHPPSCFKGLITGEIRRYWLQNDPKTFQDILAKFLEHLLNKGHTLENLIPLIKHTASLLDSSITNPIESPYPTDNTLYIHRTYHPNGLQRHDIRQLYDAILKPYLNFEKMTVDISRPTNLRDVLTSAKLKAPPHLSVTKLVTDLKQKQQQHP